MMGMPEWDGTSESAQEINRAFNDVLDVLVNAGMWTGDPPYRGKCAAEQVRMLVQRATTGEQLATDILAELATERARAEAAEARALEEEAISYDIAAKAALDAQNWREELTVMRQRLDAAEAKLAAARADLDLVVGYLVVGYLDAVMNGLSVKELAQLADVAAEVRQRWGLEA